MAISINGTTGVSGVDGSASAPALTGTDANTGINFGSDIIDLSTGGSSRFKVGAAGQLGVAGANYGTAGQALLSQGASAAPQWGAVAGGISEADSWRITANFTGDAPSDRISSNWERFDTSPWETKLGTGLTESSGVFSFPSTGYYLILWSHYCYLDGGSPWNEMEIRLTNDNGGNYISHTHTEMYFRDTGSTQYNKATESAILDITNISNQKFWFNVEVQNDGVTTLGSSSKKQTGFDIFRLGDT